MSWIKDCKESLIELGRAAGVFSTQQERDTDIQVHIEENNSKIVELKKNQKITWGKAAVELREMGVTQADFDLLNSINPLGVTLLNTNTNTAKNRAKPNADTNTDTDVEVQKDDAEGLATN